MAAVQPMTDEEIAHWSNWALQQADRIDPICSGRYRALPQDLDIDSLEHDEKTLD